MLVITTKQYLMGQARAANKLQLKYLFSSESDLSCWCEASKNILQNILNS